MNKHIENSVSAIKETADKDRENFNNQFEKVSKAIATVDSKIVKEDDLTELFQNYTLNVNISGNDKPKKRKFLKRWVIVMNEYKDILVTIMLFE